MSMDALIEIDVLRTALREIQNVSNYASDSDEARLKMLAWIGEAARLALRGEILPLPMRSGSFKPGDVLVKAGPFPPLKGK